MKYIEPPFRRKWHDIFGILNEEGPKAAMMTSEGNYYRAF